MAFGVSNQQVISTNHCNAVRNIAQKKLEHAAYTTPFHECNTGGYLPATSLELVNQHPTWHGNSFLSNADEVSFMDFAPEPEFEVEVESSNTPARRRTRYLKIQKRLRVTQPQAYRVSAINRPRFWAKQMKRRRMCLFGDAQRTKPRCQFSKRWNPVVSPAPSRVDAKILQLLQRKRKQLKRDGLYQFVLWREALRAERNRLMECRSMRI